MNAVRHPRRGFGHLSGAGAVTVLPTRMLAAMREQLSSVASAQPTGPRPDETLLVTDPYAFLRGVLSTHDWDGVALFYQAQIAKTFEVGQRASDFWGVSALNLREYTSEAWTVNDWAAYVRSVWSKYVVVDIGEDGKVGFGADPNYWLQLDKYSKLSTSTHVDIITFWTAVTGYQYQSGQYAAPNPYPPANLGWIQAPRGMWSGLIFNIIAGAITGMALFAAYAAAAGAVAASSAASAGAASAAGTVSATGASAASVAAASAIPEIIVTAVAPSAFSAGAAAAGATAASVAAASASGSATPQAIEEVITTASRLPTAAEIAAPIVGAGAAVAMTPSAIEEIVVEGARTPEQPQVTQEQIAAAGTTVNAVQNAQSTETQSAETDGKKGFLQNFLDTIAALLPAAGSGGATPGISADVETSPNYPVIPGTQPPKSILAGAGPWLLLALLIGTIATESQTKQKRRRRVRKWP